AGQPDVEDDDVVLRADDAVEAGLARLHGFDAVALVAQHAAQRAPDAGFVVNDQNRRLQHGSSITNREPCGTLSPTSMDPPCSATMRRTMARPRPLPRPLVE